MNLKPPTPAIDAQKILHDAFLIGGSMNPEDFATLKDGMLKKLNQFYAEEMLRIIGPDEVRPASGPKRNGIEQGLRRTRNKLKAELRTAVTRRFGGNK